MAYTTINKPSDYFNTVTYTGNATNPRAVTGVGFQPDLVWIKDRDNIYNHQVHDAIRGVDKALIPNNTSAEADYNSFVSFDSDGFSVTGTNGTNTNSAGLVAWNWLANNTSGSSNTDGSITSTVSANTTSGFSIVSYTGTGAIATVGHGLGAVPKMLIIKNRDDGSGHWRVYHASIGATVYCDLDNTGAAGPSSNVFNNTTPTNSVFSLGSDSRANGSGNAQIAYCFAEKKGFSKFGSYTGNNSSDGPFIYTGFKPAFVILKRTDGAANWQLNDSARDTFNVVNKRLSPSASDAEATNFNFGDFLSNGFKIRQTDQTWNASGGNYIYMAFAENPLVTSTKLPATAR